MAKFTRMFNGNTNFGAMEASWKEDFIKRVAESGNTKEEMIDVMKDLNVIISKAMNDTIDAAKNPGSVDMPYMDSFRTNYRSGAVATKDYAKIKLLPNQLALAPLQLSIRSAKDAVPGGKNGNPFKRTARKEQQGKSTVWVVEDLLTAVRNETAVYAYQKLNESLKASILGDLQSYKTQDERLYKSLKHLAECYDSVMHIENGDKKAMKKAIVQMSRNLIRNNSQADPRNLFQEAYLASQYTDRKSNSVRTNSYYMAFTHEAANYFVRKYNPDGMFENQVYAFDGNIKAKIGQRIHFVKGISTDKCFHAETPVNGAYTLMINNDLQAVIRKPVVDMIPNAEYDDTVVFMQLMDKDIETAVGLIEKARAAKARFGIRYYKPAGDSRDNLHLIAGKTPIARIVNPSNQGGRSRYESMIANRFVTVDQIEILPPRKQGDITRVFVVGHITK